MWANHRTGGRGGAKGHTGVSVILGGASERALKCGVFLFGCPQSSLNEHLPRSCDFSVVAMCVADERPDHVFHVPVLPRTWLTEDWLVSL